jgi:hypothetical protein
MSPREEILPALAPGVGCAARTKAGRSELVRTAHPTGLRVSQLTRSARYTYTNPSMKRPLSALAHPAARRMLCGVWLVALMGALPPSLASAASIEVVPGTNGAAGDTVSISLQLRAQDETIVAAQNDLGFDRRNTPVASLANGMPDCTVDPATGKDSALFGFQPIGCGTSVPCTAVRAVILSLDNIDPIPNGSTLYTCRVAIAASAAPGTYPLTVSGVVLVDPEANELPGSQGVNGSIAVTEPPAVCGGDCNGDGTVAINELVIGVSIVLGALPVDACPGFTGEDATVDITDLIAAVNDALSGCNAAADTASL